MSVTLNYTSKTTVVETLETNVPAATTKAIYHTGFDTTLAATAESTPPITKCAFFEQALTAGEATIDLTALTGTNGITVDGTGLRVQFLKLRNPATNTGNMTLSSPVTTGYDGFGAKEAFSVTVPPGGEILIRTKDGGTDIGATNKNLDLDGTSTEVAEIGIVLG